MNDPIPLTQLQPGQIAQVLSINEKYKNQARLASMGLLVGSQIEVIQAGDSILVAIGSIRLGIGLSIAEQIMVKII